MKINKIIMGILYILICTACIMMVIPFIIMGFTSLKDSSEIMSPVFKLLPEKFLFHNYVEAMTSTTWNRFFINSAIVTSITVVVSLVINSLAGFAFARLNFKGKNVLFLLALIGMMIPQQVTMLPNFVILKYFPLSGGNNILGMGGKGLINSYGGLILPYIAGAFGVFLFRQFYMNFPGSLDDACKVDGLGRVGMFTRIYVPLSKSIFATLIVFKTTSVWNEYTWPLIVTQVRDKWTVQLALSVFKLETTTQWNYLMAATTLITLPLFILYIFMQKYFVEGIVTTGIKG